SLACPLMCPTLRPPSYALHILPLSLHDALPICSTAPDGGGPPSISVGCCAAEPSPKKICGWCGSWTVRRRLWRCSRRACGATARSEEYTSELQSRSDNVCRFLLEKKKS